MNGDVGVKKAAMNKVKQVASAAATSVANPITNGNKKRRKGQDLKPIITGEKENGDSGGIAGGGTGSGGNGGGNSNGGAPQTPATTTSTTSNNSVAGVATAGQKNAQRYF